MQFAQRMAGIRASEIREILKVTARPEVISFAGGLPAPELFPAATLGALAARILAEDGARALQYSTTEGDPALRAAIARRLSARRGLALEAADVLVTTGSQQALDLIGKLFLDEGDAVLCESPTYLGAISSWNVLSPRWVEVPTDDEGMLPAALERRLAATPRARLAYVVANFQNPSGRTWSLARRRAVAPILAAHDVVLVEDDPYGEIRFEGDDQPAIASQPGAGDVLSLGTFSKILCPGLRVGWVSGPRRLLEKLAILKQGADLHTSTFDQALIAAYLRTGELDANIARVVAVYRERRDAMLAALARELGTTARWTRPSGGLFLWLELPPGIDARDLLARCLAVDVAFVPGGPFFPNGGHEHFARLNFSNMPPARIAEGVRRLGRALAGMARPVAIAS